jgi:4-hydroxy-tetrahydrodipicolinate synthase
MESSPRSVWSGTGVALVTPFAHDGSLDLAALRRVVEHVISGGVDYLVPMGTTGETATLSDVESAQVIETVIEANAGRKPILLGCGGNDTARVTARLRHYEQYPVQGYLSVSPYYNRPTQEGIYRHYCALAEATSRPIVLYNVPPRTGSNVLPETVLRIAHSCPSIVAVKEASGSIDQGAAIVRAAPAGFAVLSGDDALAVPGIAVGYQGLISVAANVVPARVSNMIRDALAGDFAAARAEHLSLIPLIQALFAEGNPAGAKAALKQLGITEGTVRLPLVEASESLRETLISLL